MAATLAQIIGVEQGVRASTEQWQKAVRQALHNEDMLKGHTKTYEPEEGQLPQPDDKRRVQANVEQLVGEARKRLARYFDITASKDWGNMGDGGARADIVYDGHPILRDVPATYLLFLQARLKELYSDIQRIPVQSAAEDWQPSTTPGEFRTTQIKTHSTRQNIRYDVIGQTVEHPGQLVQYPEHVVSGTWTTVKFTSAPTAAWQQAVLKNIADLGEAVQSAIYDANKIEVEDRHVSGEILGFIFDRENVNGARK